MSTAQIFRYPTGDQNRNRLWVRFKRIDFRWDNAEGRMKATSASKQPSIYLYLPASINLKDGLSYNTSSDIGILGRGIEDLLNTNGTNFNANWEQRISQGLNFLTSTVTDAARVGQTLLTGEGSINPALVALTMRRFANFDRSAEGSAVRSATRHTVNPHRRALFESVNLREFSFNFEFMPNNEEEARQVEQIIKFFRLTAYPTLSSIDPDEFSNLRDTANVESEEEPSGGSISEILGDVAGELVYKFPSMLQVDMFYELDPNSYRILEQAERQNVDVESLFNNIKQDEVVSSGLIRVGPRIKPCYITGIDRTLDNQNAMVYRALGNKAVPVSQTLGISLSEDRPISANDVRFGF